MEEFFQQHMWDITKTLHDVKLAFRETVHDVNDFEMQK